MKIEYLKTVLAVAKFRSLKKAAESIPCSYSAVTKHISAVENELQTELFVRHAHNKQVILTEAGVKGLEYIQNIVAQYEKLEKAVKPLAGLEKKEHLKISVDGNLMGSMAISNLISECYVTHPEISVSILRNDYIHGMEQLRQGKLDAVLNMRYQWKAAVEVFDFGDDVEAVYMAGVPVSLMAGKNNKRLVKPSYSLWDLKTEKFLFGLNVSDMKAELESESKYVVNGNFLKVCMMKGFIPNIEKVDVLIQDTNLADVKAALLERDQGVSLSVLPKKLRDNIRLKYMEINDMPYYVEYYFIFMKNTDKKSLTAMAHYIRELFSEQD